MNYFIINVTGKHGYSFMVCGEFADEYDAIEHAASADLFDDVNDIEYAFADGLVTEQDIEHFKNDGCCYTC